MFYFFFFFLPLFIYPLGLACSLLGIALLLRHQAHWQTRLVALTLALLWLGGNRIVTMTLVRSLEGRYPPVSAANLPHADAIVVLGGVTRAQTYPRPTHEMNEAGDRLLYGAWLYRQGAAPRILLSGGETLWTGPNLAAEADAMAEILAVMGIPPEALLLERKSYNTYKNAVESYKILAQHGYTRIILVTSAMHMPRAYPLFAATGVTVIPAPTDFLVTQADWEYYTQPKLSTQAFNLLPSASDLELTSRVLKEYIGIVVYTLRGY